MVQPGWSNYAKAPATALGLTQRVEREPNPTEAGSTLQVDGNSCALGFIAALNRRLFIGLRDGKI
jgi:hypothetical protein